MYDESKGISQYEDIINLSHPISRKHPQMSAIDRAAQFSPFAALTGHNEAVKETARLTDKKIELDENAIEILNDRLQQIFDNLSLRPAVFFTYFVKDKCKEGGSYITIKGTVKKLDKYAQTVIMEDSTVIPIDDIIDIEIIAE